MTERNDKKIRFEMWNDSDEASILALVRRNYGDYDTSFPEYFDWEYRKNPAGRAIIGCGKASDGTVVTALATVPTPVLFRGEKLPACQLVNGMTHPDYRGRGLFAECGRMVVRALKEAGIALSYGFPNPNSFPTLTRNIGYHDIGRAQLMAFLFRPAALASARFPAARFLEKGNIDRLLAKLLHGMLQKKPRLKMEVKRRESFSGLPLEKLREQAELVVDADVDWFNWRYVNVPRRPYRIIIAGADDEPLGVAVYRVSVWENVKVGTLNELFLPANPEADAFESLVAHVVDECEQSGCAAIFCLVTPSSRKEEMLRRLGFLAVPPRFEPQPFAVIMQGHSVSIEGITAGNMAISFGAYDVF